MKSSLTVAKPSSLKRKIFAETEIALQDAIADSANEGPGFFAPVSEIKELEQANIENLPSGKELAAKNNSSLSTDKTKSLRCPSKLKCE